MNRNTQQMTANGGSGGGSVSHVPKDKFETSLKDVQQIESIIRELGTTKGRNLHAISNATGLAISCLKARMAMYNARLMEIAQLKISRGNAFSGPGVGPGSGPGPGPGPGRQQQQQQLQLMPAQAKLIIHTAIALSLNGMAMPQALEQAESHEHQQARQWEDYQRRLRRYASY